MSTSSADADVGARSSTARRLGWMAIAVAIVGGGMMAAVALGGGPTRWWQLALPALAVGNTAVWVLGVLRHSPRLKATYSVASFAIAVAILFAAVSSFAR